MEVGSRSYWKLEVEVGSWKLEFEISNFKFQISN